MDFDDSSSSSSSNASSDGSLPMYSGVAARGPGALHHDPARLDDAPDEPTQRRRGRSSSSSSSRSVDSAREQLPERPNAPRGFLDEQSDADDDDVKRTSDDEARCGDDNEGAYDAVPEAAADPDTESERLRPVELPDWAKDLQRPATSAKVGRFSSRDDEFTRHMHFPEQPDEPEGSPLSNVPCEIVEGRLDSGIPGGRDGAAMEADEEEEEEPFPTTDAAQWTTYLESGVLVDETPFTQLYRVVDVDDNGHGQVSLFKVLSPPLPEDAISSDFDRVRILAERLCRSMIRSAEQINADDELRTGGVMSGIVEVHCDTQTRLIVQLEPHEHTVSLLDLAAFSAPTAEHVRVLVTKVVHQLTKLHSKGNVHGTLHGGNILVQSNSAELIFTDGCGLMSSPVLSPDFSFLSPHLATHLKELLPTDIDAAATPNAFLNDLWISFYEDPYQESVRDDWYAVAQLVALLIHGYPSRHAMTVWEAVSDLDIHAAPRLLSTSTGGDYFRSRAGSAGFTQEFLHQAQHFIDTLVSLEALDRYDELLEHPFLLSAQQLAEHEDLEERMNELIIQLSAEADRNMEFWRANAGSRPLQLRPYRNALFSSRLEAAQGCLSGVLASPTLPRGVSLVADDVVLVEGHALTVSLCHAFPANRSKLIIRNVSDSTVVILGHFRHVMICHVSQCSIAIGPCEKCLLEHVSSCPRVALAAHQTMFREMRDVVLALHGVEVPLCPTPSTIHNVAIVPYNISYPGLTHDFAVVGLTEESKASLFAYEHPEVVLENRQPLELLMTWRTGHDYPWLKQLATNSKTVRVQQSLDDVFLFHGEATDCSVVVEDVRGGPMTQSSHVLLAPDSPSRIRKHVFPVLVVLDVLENVSIADCENLTIVVCGAKGSVSVSSVRHAKLFVCGVYVMLSDCADCEVHAFALKGAMIEDCTNVQVMPLVADLPHIDAILQSLGDSCGLPAVAPSDNLFLTPRVQVHNNKECNILQRPQCCYRLAVPALDGSASSKFTSSFPLSDGSAATLVELDLRSSLFDGQYLGLKKTDVVMSGAEATAAFSNLFDCSILRIPTTLCAARPDAGRRSEPSCHLALRELHAGIVHIADAVGILTIANCTGPLDVIVAAAQEVYVVNCTNLTLQVACFSFAAHACRNCHFALHVNTEPQLIQSQNIVLSALNVTCANFEEVLDRASVQQHSNLFDHPVDPDSSNADIRARRGVEDVLVDLRASAETMPPLSLPIEDLSAARRILRQRWWAAPPLPSTCVGTLDAPFLEALEDRVAKEVNRPQATLAILEALSLLGNSLELEAGSPTSRSAEHASTDGGDVQLGVSGVADRHNHFDSSDEENDEEPSHNTSTHDSPSRPRSSSSSARRSSVEADRDTVFLASNASAAPAAAVVGSMVDRDSSESEESWESSDEDAYVHRAAAAAVASAAATTAADDVPSASATADVVDDVEQPQRSTSPVGLGGNSVSGEKASSAVNPLRGDVADFKEFLKQQSLSPQRAVGGTSSDLATSSDDIRFDEFPTVGNDDEPDEHDRAAANHHDTSADDTAAAQQPQSVSSRLGFDDSTSDEDDNANETKPLRVVVSREKAAEAMGISSSSLRKGGLRNIVPEGATSANDQSIDESSNPMANLRRDDHRTCLHESRAVETNSSSSSTQLTVPFGSDITPPTGAHSSPRSEPLSTTQGVVNVLERAREDDEAELRWVASVCSDASRKQHTIDIVTRVQSLRRQRLEAMRSMGDLNELVSRALNAALNKKGK